MDLSTMLLNHLPSDQSNVIFDLFQDSVLEGEPLKQIEGERGLLSEARAVVFGQDTVSLSDLEMEQQVLEFVSRAQHVLAAGAYKDPGNTTSREVRFCKLAMDWAFLTGIISYQGRLH